MRVYIAHPSFTDEQEKFKKDFMSSLRASLLAGPYGRHIALVDPFLYTPNIEGDRDAKIRESSAVKEACLRLLEDSHVIIAVVDWHDTGTAFEAGYGHAINIPLILVSRASCADANAMLLGAAKETIDNVLDDQSMVRLSEMLNWFYVSLRRYPPDPHTN